MCTTFDTTSARRRLALDATMSQLAAEGFSEPQIHDAMWDCARLEDPEAEREAAYAAEVYSHDFSTHDSGGASEGQDGFRLTANAMTSAAVANF